MPAVAVPVGLIALIIILTDTLPFVFISSRAFAIVATLATPTSTIRGFILWRLNLWIRETALGCEFVQKTAYHAVDLLKAPARLLIASFLLEELF